MVTEKKYYMLLHTTIKYYILIQKKILHKITKHTTWKRQFLNQKSIKLCRLQNNSQPDYAKKFHLYNYLYKY